MSDRDTHKSSLAKFNHYEHDRETVTGNDRRLYSYPEKSTFVLFRVFPHTLVPLTLQLC